MINVNNIKSSILKRSKSLAIKNLLKTSHALSTACIHEEIIIHILQGSKKDHEPTEI